MTEPVIAAVESAAGPLVQAAVKALAPEAEALLGELHDVALSAVARIDQVVPELLAKAENESAIALRGAQQHLAALLDHVGGLLHVSTAAPMPQQVGPAIPVPPDGTPSAWGVASNPVGPTPAPEAHTQS